MNRLCAAAEGATAVSISGCGTSLGTNNWQQIFAYDNLGNRAVLNNNSGIQSSMLASNYTPQVSTYSAAGVTAVFPSNRWTGVSQYDNAGNVMGMQTQSMTYDGDSHMTSWSDSSTNPTTRLSFTYDGLGRRVTKTSSAGTTTFVYDPLGNLAAAYGGAAPAVTGTLYLTTDHLGSTRLVTSGGTVVGCHDYLPFGEEIPNGMFGRSGIPCFGTADTSVKFTGQERDAETATNTIMSGLDHFPARYGSGAMGRFLSPDPVGNFVADMGNPQSWNMYGYARNNPLRFIDPSGLCSQDSNGNLNDSDDGGTLISPGPCGTTIGDFGNSGANSTTVNSTAPQAPYDFSGYADEDFLNTIFYNDSFSTASTAGGSNPNTLTPQQQKQNYLNCRQQFLTSHLGSFVGTKVVPFFSLGTLVDAPLEYAKSSAEAIAFKGVPTYLLGRYGGYLAGHGGQLLFGGYSAAGAPLSSYAISEGAGLLSTGLAIHAGVQTVAKFAGGVGIALTVSSTAVDLWARHSCGGF